MFSRFGRFKRPFIFFTTMAQTIAVCHVFWKYAFHLASASGGSMLPTISAYGDTLLVNCTYRRGRGIRVGDLVAYKIPIFDGATGVKRVLGLPGDYVLLHTPGAGANPDPTMIQVPQGHCWIAGDNLEASRDSREFGPIPLALIVGKVDAKVFPLREAHWFENPLDQSRPHR